MQAPDLTQNFNRYSYCLNNPLKYTDPSGEFITAAVIVGAIVGAYIGGSIANDDWDPTEWDYQDGATWAYMAGGAAIGALGGYSLAAAPSTFLMNGTGNALINYTVQVAGNYSRGLEGWDAWFNKVDVFDVGASFIIGGSGASFDSFYALDVKELFYFASPFVTNAVDYYGDGHLDDLRNKNGWGYVGNSILAGGSNVALGKFRELFGNKSNSYFEVSKTVINEYYNFKFRTNDVIEDNNFPEPNLSPNNMPNLPERYKP